ncbi:putative inorganic phosphate cotransporter [Sitophilus oryzae]|uniref:Putative inorganic phosphate cotransporter n=1 Tax=Sitophilus oryzae TaxID=7048 RepID=A0A6J2XT05_SITOR|nr:putative inorganic phosphate cotransporter [Sitophilus oryzae]
MASLAKKKVSVQINDTKLQIMEIKPNKIEEEITDKGPTFGCRYVQIILMMVGITLAIGMRTNLSVAIVAMTNSTASPNPNIPTYDWKNTSVILSSIFWSYITLQVVAGYVGRTYGVKYFLLGAYIVNCIGQLLIPLAAEHLGSTGVILCRIIQGFGQSFLYPSGHVILGTWVPFEERTTLGNIMWSGIYLGSIFGSVSAGYICESWLGWPFLFYLMGSLGLAWSVLWTIFGQSSPDTHPRITKEEKKYIQASLKQESNIQIPVPWKKIFNFVPMYALLLWYFSNVWCYNTMMAEMPTYLSKVMKYSVQSSGLVASVSTAATFVFALLTGPLSDWIIRNKYLSTVTSRRLFNSIATFGLAGCLIWLGYLEPSNPHMSILVLGLMGMVSAGILAGGSVSHLDISPRFSGVLFGLLNGTSQIFSIAGPLLCQWLITDLTDPLKWRMLFLGSAGFAIVGGVVYVIFITADRQPWDGPETRQSKIRKISTVSLTGI